MPKTSSAFRMADRLAGGQLASIILAARDADEPYEALARRLHATYGIDVTARTVATWFAALSEPDAEAVNQ